MCGALEDLTKSFPERKEGSFVNSEPSQDCKDRVTVPTATCCVSLKLKFSETAKMALSKGACYIGLVT